MAATATACPLIGETLPGGIVQGRGLLSPPVLHLLLEGVC
jgi:hypothetical protein